MNIQLPSQKEWAAGIAGLVTWGLLYGLSYAGIAVPEAAQPGIALLFAVIIARIVPPSQQDVLKHVDDTIAQAGVIIGKLTAASDQAAPASSAAKALAAKVQP